MRQTCLTLSFSIARHGFGCTQYWINWIDQSVRTCVSECDWEIVCLCASRSLRFIWHLISFKLKCYFHAVSSNRLIQINVFVHLFVPQHFWCTVSTDLSNRISTIRLFDVWIVKWRQSHTCRMSYSNIDEFMVAQPFSHLWYSFGKMHPIMDLKWIFNFLENLSWFIFPSIPNHFDPFASLLRLVLFMVVCLFFGWFFFLRQLSIQLLHGWEKEGRILWVGQKCHSNFERLCSLPIRKTIPNNLWIEMKKKIYIYIVSCQVSGIIKSKRPHLTMFLSYVCVCPIVLLESMIVIFRRTHGNSYDLTHRQFKQSIEQPNTLTQSHTGRIIVCEKFSIVQ